MRRLQALLLPCLLAAASAGHAAEPVRIAGAVPYRDGVGSAAMRAECTWNQRLASEIVKGSHGAVASTAEPLEGLAGAVLHLEVVSAHAAGGGVHSGAKWATIRGELRGRGEQPLAFEIRRTTTRGWKACTSMDRIADALARDVLTWLANPSAFPAATPTAAGS